MNEKMKQTMCKHVRYNYHSNNQSKKLGRCILIQPFPKTHSKDMKFIYTFE